MYSLCTILFLSCFLKKGQYIVLVQFPEESRHMTTVCTMKPLKTCKKEMIKYKVWLVLILMSTLNALMVVLRRISELDTVPLIQKTILVVLPLSDTFAIDGTKKDIGIKYCIFNSLKYSYRTAHSYTFVLQCHTSLIWFCLLLFFVQTCFTLPTKRDATHENERFCISIIVIFVLLSIYGMFST